MPTNTLPPPTRTLRDREPNKLESLVLTLSEDHTNLSIQTVIQTARKKGIRLPGGRRVDTFDLIRQLGTLARENGWTTYRKNGVYHLRTIPEEVS